MKLTKQEQNIFLLSLAKGMTADKIDRLINYYGSIDEALLYIDDTDFIFPKLRDSVKRQLDADVHALIKPYENAGISVVTRLSTDYPSMLDIQSRPAVLYVLGDVSLLGGGVSIIGSRACTAYGMHVASMLGSAAGKAGITVISGGARGIDTAALTACRKQGGKAIAVLGSGLNVVYPSENADLFDDISKNGALISEFPLSTPAYPSNFPTRNRIISGLCDLLAVVEAGLKSGTNSTVRWAQSQGKEIACVPGNITSEQSEGVNKLIKEGAAIITEANDILEFFGKKAPKIVKKTVKLDAAEMEIVSVLKKEYQLSLDEITQKCNNSAGKVASSVTMLELKGVLLRQGGLYTLNTDNKYSL